MNVKDLLTKLMAKKHLTQKEAVFLVSEMAEGKVPAAQMAAFLVLLKSKGETVDEIAGFIKGMRKYMVKVPPFAKASGGKQNVMDVCGTGGDGLGTFNISTTVAFVVAGGGMRVAKHGNRAASSKSGSADVLEVLGVNINTNPQHANTVLEKTGMVFLFAPLFHPAMKYIGPVRKELGVPTIFNMLGPFLNPVQVKRQIIGVPNITTAKKLAKVASKLSYKHLVIVSSIDGMDEVSISKPTKLFEIKGNKISHKTIKPEDFGIQRVSIGKVLGKDPKENAKIIKDILEGKKGPNRDIVILNSALALYVGGIAGSMRDGIILAKESIDNKKALTVLNNLITETKKYE